MSVSKQWLSTAKVKSTWTGAEEPYRAWAEASIKKLSVDSIRRQLDLHFAKMNSVEQVEQVSFNLLGFIIASVSSFRKGYELAEVVMDSAERATETLKGSEVAFEDR